MLGASRFCQRGFTLGGFTQRGFTLVELISVLIIVAVLGVIATSRFISNSSFELQEARDQVVLAFRSAQQLAMTQADSVSFQSTASSIDIRQDGSSVTVNGVQYPLSFSGNQSISTSVFSFDRLGRTDPGTMTLSNNGSSVSLSISSAGHIE